MHLQLPAVLANFVQLSLELLFTYWFDSGNAAFRAAAVITDTQAVIVIDRPVVTTTTGQNHTVMLTIAIKLCLAVFDAVNARISQFWVYQPAHVGFGTTFTRLWVVHQ